MSVLGSRPHRDDTARSHCSRGGRRDTIRRYRLPAARVAAISLGVEDAFHPVTDPEALAALARILDDAPLRERLRRVGFARAAAYSWRETARRTRQVYDDVLGDASGST